VYVFDERFERKFLWLQGLKIFQLLLKRLNFCHWGGRKNLPKSCQNGKLSRITKLVRYRFELCIVELFFSLCVQVSFQFCCRTKSGFIHKRESESFFFWTGILWLGRIRQRKLCQPCVLNGLFQESQAVKVLRKALSPPPPHPLSFLFPFTSLVTLGPAWPIFSLGICQEHYLLAA